MATQTVTEAFAAAMELENPEDRATVARWLTRATRAGLWLDAGSIREAGEEKMRELLDGAKA
jgi:hypothetical protein